MTTGSSPALAAAVQRGVLRVLVTSDDGDVVALTTALLEQFLTLGPKVKLDVSATSADQATTSLNAGDADLVVSDKVRGRGATALFTSGGDTWFVTQGPTGGQLVSQIGSFLTAALAGDVQCEPNGRRGRARPELLRDHVPQGDRRWR